MKANDNYGHAVGDTTLQHFSKILSDIAPEEKMIAGRWSGFCCCVNIFVNKTGFNVYEKLYFSKK
ncbi:MAG: diguanylate cyclase [Ruminococcaceae bacterium]|nr:diguanylate cyclase [Oscillospiraceae bacterium]